MWPPSQMRAGVLICVPHLSHQGIGLRDPNEVIPLFPCSVTLLAVCPRASLNLSVQSLPLRDV